MARKRRIHQFAPAACLAALVVCAASAQAAPTNLTVVQEGPSLRVSWTPAAPDDSHSIEISNSPDFPSYVTGNTCFDFVLRGSTTLMRCLIPFNGTVHVRVAPTIGAGTTVAIPQSAFTFAPVPAVRVATTVRNRRSIGCTVARGDFTNIDGQTTFRGRITVGGVERVAADLPNPVSGDRPIFAKDRIDYALTGRDVGRAVRCEVTAAQGSYRGTLVDEAVVGHALPEEMLPAAMLGEAIPPATWFEGNVAPVPVTAAARRGGAIRRAKLHVATIGVSSTLDMDVTLTTHRTPRQADRSLGAVCRDLRRTYARRARQGVVRQILECRRANAPGTRRAYSATAYATSVRDDGVPILVVQAITIGSAGNSSFVLSAVAGDTFARRAGTLRRAQRTAAVHAPRVVAAAIRE